MLLNELFNLKEAAMDIVSTEDYWQQNESSANEYVSSKTYLVRELDGVKSISRFQVFQDISGKREGPDLITKYQLDANFEPVRPNQQPDAEGFILYRSTLEIDAIKHKQDPMKILIGTNEMTLAKNNYITRRMVHNKFEFSIEKSSVFENNFIKK